MQQDAYDRTEEYRKKNRRGDGQLRVVSLCDLRLHVGKAVKNQMRQMKCDHRMEKIDAIGSISDVFQDFQKKVC